MLMPRGYPPGGGDEPPHKRFKMSGRDEKMNLRQRHIRILELMIQYHTIYGVVPRANSADFYHFVLGNGLRRITQEKLTLGILFMEEAFENTVKTRGMNVHFTEQHLEERFQLSKQIWGPLHNQRGRLEQIEEEHFGGSLDYQFDDDFDDLDDVVDEEQDVMDVAILRTIHEFRIVNDGRIPEPDSDNLYNFLVSLGIGNIQQEKLVDRILKIEENYSRIETRRVIGDIMDFATPARQEIYHLSNRLWGDNIHQDISGESIMDDGGNVFDRKDGGNIFDKQYGGNMFDITDFGNILDAVFGNMVNIRVGQVDDIVIRRDDEQVDLDGDVEIGLGGDEQVDQGSVVEVGGDVQVDQVGGVVIRGDDELVDPGGGVEIRGDDEQVDQGGGGVVIRGDDKQVDRGGGGVEIGLGGDEQVDQGGAVEIGLGGDEQVDQGGAVEVGGEQVDQGGGVENVGAEDDDQDDVED